ncbi:MAG: XrtA/PEP-CTERM system histidine kinase PrsK [Geminicoccaceae bacterium]
MLTACFALALLSCSLCGVLLARGWRGPRAGLLLLAAVGGTWLWAAIGLIDAAAAGQLAGELEIVNGLRAALWVWLVYAVLGLVRSGTVAFADWRGLLFRLGAGLAMLKLVLAILALAPDAAEPVRQLDRAAGLTLAVLGLLLVENVYTASDHGMRWALKHLLIAAGFLFAFDMFRYADALLVRQFSDVAAVAQALLSAIVAPLLVVAAARIRQFSIAVHVARRFVLHTSALVFSGIYLLIVALTGFLLRQLDLTWGPALQIASLIGALVLLALLLSSGQARTYGRRLIERSFFNFAYDYRGEWLRFVANMADGSAGMHERVIRAVAEPLDCSAGLLYLRENNGGYRCVSAWNWRQAANGRPPPSSMLAGLEEGSATVIDLRHAGTTWPDRSLGAWLLLGLRSRDRCLGFLLLGRPRIVRRLTWEDHDLLGIFAAQIGGYLAEERAARALAETQRFTSVAKGFSFVAHDLKNVVTQLSLMLQQARHHGDKPEFMRDTLLTVSESVDKMRAVLLRLREGFEEGAKRPVDLVSLIESVAEQRRRTGQALRLDLARGPLIVSAEPGAAAGLVGNLIDNARDAGGETVEIVLTLAPTEDGYALIEVHDDGPGMSPEFVAEHLFRPFVSGKPDGFGIGLYQCREWAERWGGQLDVASVPGMGTSVQLRLPLLPEGSTVQPVKPMPDAAASALRACG